MWRRRCTISPTNLYADQGHCDAAEPLYKQALAIYRRMLGGDHPFIATLNDLANCYRKESRHADAESLYEHALAMRERIFGPNHPDVAIVLNGLTALYQDQERYSDALPLVERTVASGDADPEVALPILASAERGRSIAPTAALDDSLNVVQQALQTAAGKALNALATRFAAGTDRLADLVRKDQDLAGKPRLSTNRSLRPSACHGRSGRRPLNGK